jgi:hypothetical protein
MSEESGSPEGVSMFSTWKSIVEAGSHSPQISFQISTSPPKGKSVAPAVQWINRRLEDHTYIEKMLEDDSIDTESKKKLVYYLIMGPNFDAKAVEVVIKKYVPDIIDIEDILWSKMVPFSVDGKQFNASFNGGRRTSFADYLVQIYPPSSYNETTFNNYILTKNTSEPKDHIQEIITLLTESNNRITIKTFEHVMDFEPHVENLPEVLELIEICLDKMESVNLTACYKCVFNMIWIDSTGSINSDASLHEQLLIPFTTRGYVFPAGAIEMLTDVSCKNFDSVCGSITNLEFIGSHAGSESILKFLIKHLEENVEHVDGGYVLNALKYLASQKVDLSAVFP